MAQSQLWAALYHSLGDSYELDLNALVSFLPARNMRRDRET